MRRMAALGFLLILAAASGARGETLKPPPTRSTDQPRPRDGNVAIQQELDAARRAGTLAAYDLFLARHGNHPLTRTARRERAAVAARLK